MSRTEPYLPAWLRRLGVGAGCVAALAGLGALWIGQCMALTHAAGHGRACLRPLACRIAHEAGWTDRAALSWLGWTALALACAPVALCALEGQVARWRHDPGERMP